MSAECYAGNVARPSQALRNSTCINRSNFWICCKVALLVIVLLTVVSSVSADPVIGNYSTISNDVSAIGQLVVIRIAPHPDKLLLITINDGTNTFRYNGQNIGSIGFQPQQAGEHTLTIREITGELLETLSFNITQNINETIALNTTNATETVLPTRTHLIETDKQNYILGDQVKITLLTNDTSTLHLNIVYNDQVFRFLGDLPQVSTYQPKQAGAYRVVLSGNEGSTIDSFVFTVEDNTNTSMQTEQPTENTSPQIAAFIGGFENSTQKFRVRNARNDPLDGTLFFLPHNSHDGVMASMLDAQKFNLTGPTDIDFVPNSSRIQRVSVHNIVSQNLDLGVDEFSDQPIPLPLDTDEKKHAWSSLYAIDPTRTNASNITLTVTATGNELFTCKDWDYANRACLGAWVKVRDITPGENYSITIDPNDPGFGEEVSIPSAGWSNTIAGTTFNIKLCTDIACGNVSTAFVRGQTMYIWINMSPAFAQTTTTNSLSIYSGADTGAIYTTTFICTPTSANGPYSFCNATIPIDASWGDGWYYVNAQLRRTTAGGTFTEFDTPFVITSNEPVAGDTLKFFTDSTYSIQSDHFPQGTQVYVEFNFSGGDPASTANSAPRIRNFETDVGGGTAVTETWDNTTGPYRFHFSMPNMGTAGWYFLVPNMQNSSAGTIPAGDTDIFGRMILFQANTIPSITKVTTNSPIANPVSVGMHINWSVNFTDSDEIDQWQVFICTTNAFNSVTRVCSASTSCSNTTFDTPQNRTCDTIANSSMNKTNTGFAFICDELNCSTGSPVNWSVYNDTQKPLVSLITPINDPTGSFPKNVFTTTFNFVPSDDYGLANCSLYTNASGSWTISATNYTITNGTNNFITYTLPGDGSYKWNVLCSDYAGNANFSATNYTFSIVGPPIVNLMTPKNASYQNTRDITFNYNVTYSQPIGSCSLYINGTINQTDNAITNGATQSFFLSFSNDSIYTWNVNCTASDGNSGLGDGVYNVSTDRILYIDTVAPNVTLQSPGDLAVINVSSADFTYSANDSFAIDTCSLYVDGVVFDSETGVQNNVGVTIPVLLNNGNHPWYVTCNDSAGNLGTSLTRVVTINSSAAGSATYFETNLVNATPSVTAKINLSTVTDGTEESLISNVGSHVMKIFVIAISQPLSGNGILITANSVVNFSAMFSASRANTGYITWTLFKSNSTDDTQLVQVGNDNTGGTPITLTGKTRYFTNTTIGTATRILGTEWVKLQVDVYNGNNRVRSYTHYIDNTSTFVTFNFTRLGVLAASIASPALNLTIAQNDTFTFQCAYNCTGGSCLNVNVYAERNISNSWVALNSSANAILILNGTETNPHSFGTVNFPGNTTSFVIRGNITGVSQLRCNAISDYSNATLLDTRIIDVSTVSIPTVSLLAPPNGSYRPPGVNLTYEVSSNINLANCSLIVNGIINQTNTTPSLDIPQNFTLLSVVEGFYVWNVVCYNIKNVSGTGSNQSFFLDRWPANIVLNTPVNYSNFTTDTINFNWTANDTIDAYQICNLSIDGTVKGTNIKSNNATATNYTVGGITIGVHNWSVTCSDLAGNLNTTTNFTFNITNLADNVTLLAPANNTWNNSASITFVYNVTHQKNQAPKNCSLYINGAFNASNSTPITLGQQNTFTVSTLTDGKYSWYVACFTPDNLMSNIENRTLYIDRTPPNINLTFPLNNTLLGIFNIGFTFNVTDALSPNATCNLSLDRAVNVTLINTTNNTNTSQIINGLGDSTHNWSVACTDYVGNRNTSLVYNFTVVAPPIVTLVTPVNNGFANTLNVTFFYNASDNGIIRNCSIYFDGVLNLTNSSVVTINAISNFTINNTKEGLHNWSVSCTDSGPYMGNSSVFNVTVDVTKPVVNLSAPTNTSIMRSPIVIVNWTATDNVATTLTCNVTRKGPDGTDTSKNNIATPNGTLTAATYTGLPDGLHSWNVTCWDGAGNANFTATWQFNISVPPSITLVYPPLNNVNNSVNIRFDYIPVQTFGIANCTLIVNGVPNVTNTSITNAVDNYFNVSGFTQGIYNWSVNCTDNTGGTQNSSPKNFTVDLTPPLVTLNAPANASVVRNNTAYLNYTPTDSQSLTMTCNATVNGTVFGANTAVGNGSSQVTTALLRGGNRSYLWNVTCVDWAGNYNTSISWQFNIIAPPNVTLISPANNTPTTPNVTFFYNVSDPFGFANCSLFFDGKFNKTNATPINNSNLNNFTLNNVAPGPHNWSVQCYDNDTDVFQTDPFFFSADVTPPTIVLNAPANKTVFNVSSATFNWTATDDYSTNISCTLFVDSVNKGTLVTLNNTPGTQLVNALLDGTRFWNVTCTDQVGNVNTSETRNFVINQTPTITQNIPTDATITNNATVIFGFTPSDNDGLKNCSIFINGIFNTTNQTPITNNAQNNITINLSTAKYNWSVVCYDNGTFNLRNTSINRSLTVNLIPPTVLLNTPASGFVTNFSWIVFNWTANETFLGTLTCNVTVNGTVRASGIASPSNVPTTTNVTWLNDSFQVWNVTCVDPSGNMNTSSTRNFTVTAPPTIALNSPADGLRVKTTTNDFNFTPNDNSGIITACSLVINGVLNKTLTNLQNGTPSNITVQGFTDANYTWYLNCTDLFGNMGNSSVRTLVVDLFPPNITLNAPANASKTNSNVTFNWTAVDKGTIVTCNLTIDGVVNISNIAGTSGVPFLQPVGGLIPGPHAWNVTCWDDLLQANTSVTWNFSVVRPDLVLNTTTQIIFNDSNPDANEVLNISVNVSNTGGFPANNAIIAFWEGLPNTGVALGNVTVTVQPNSSMLVNMTWTISLGLHTISVVADPANVINEEDETNNNVSVNISTLRIFINSPVNDTVTKIQTPNVNFTMQNFTGGNLTYTIFIDGVRNGQNGTLPDNSTNVTTINTLAEGIHTIIVQANDTLKFKNSTPLRITIDLTPPSATFLTRNGTFFNQSPLVTVNITDNFAGAINYTLFINGIANVTGTAFNATPFNLTLNGLGNGLYNLTIQSNDNASNFANNSGIFIYVDNIKPVIILNSPGNNTNFINTRTVNLNFTPTDNLDTILECNVTADGVDSPVNFNVTNGTANVTTRTNLFEGVHYWNVTCWDGDNSVGQVNNVNTSATFIFGVFIGPNITLLTPVNNTLSNNATQVFTFNASDETGLANCSLIINGAINATKTTGQLTINSTNNFTVSGLNNTINWSVTCTDNSTGAAVGNSTVFNLTIDLVAPAPVINTPNATWFNNASPSMNITITDNYDPVLNWTFFVDGIINTNGSANNGTATLGSLSGVTNGTHTLILEAFDDAGNYANSSPITFYVDTVAPNVTLIAPADQTNLSVSFTALNFTATDNMANVLVCNLFLDGSLVQQYNLTNGTYGTYNTNLLLGGVHTWNATCLDNASNLGKSTTFTFFVNLPDFKVNASDIVFSNTTPVENQTVQVNATIFNIGQFNWTGNITAQFWKGDPDNGGTILANLTIKGLNMSQNTTLTINYTPAIGLNQIYVVVDPPFLTNGSIIEVNETNNKAHNDVWVGLFEVFAGGQTGTLRISDSNIISAFTWNQSNVTGSNVLVADTDSVLSFTSLQAIGRNITNGTAVGANDFEEIDTKLGTTSLNDSVNATFTGGGSPKSLINLTVFKKRIDNVPYINSTNTSSFFTGIVWDTSDANPGFYNGNQDIVFLTQMNQSQQGAYGVYDYEIAVPAKLRDYIAGGGTVTFYTELR